MPEAQAGLALEWVERGNGCLTLIVDTTLYPEEALFRACYLFTDRCYLFLERSGEPTPRELEK